MVFERGVRAKPELDYVSKLAWQSFNMRGGVWPRVINHMGEIYLLVTYDNPNRAEYERCDFVLNINHA